MQYAIGYDFATTYSCGYIPGMDTLDTVAARLDWAMRAAKFESQMDLARASKVPQPTINRILKGGGKRGPETDTLKKLAEACDVSFEWLNEGLGDTGRPRKVFISHNVADTEAAEAVVRAGDILRLLENFANSNDEGRRMILTLATRMATQSASASGADITDRKKA